MTEASKEPKKPTDTESETNLASTIEQPEELVRKKVVPPPPDDADQSGDDDRSPGGSGRGLGQSVTAPPQPKDEQSGSSET